MSVLETPGWTPILQALRAALRSQSLGEPVSLRVMRVCARLEGDVLDEAGRLAGLFEIALGTAPDSVLALVDAATSSPSPGDNLTVGQLSRCHLLIQSRGAASASLTVVKVERGTPRLDLLLTGTRGILRLEGGAELNLEEMGAIGPVIHGWRETVDRSVATGAFQPLPATNSHIS